VPQIVLVRHGETEWSRSGRHTGLTDVALTARGEAQASALRAVLAPARFGLVLTSPLQRARRTAELAGLGPAQVDPDLAEWDYGGYEGRTTDEIRTELGTPWTLFGDGVVPGVTPGETLDQVADRAGRVLRRIRPVLARGQDVALVGHGHQLRVLACCWLDLQPCHAARFTLSAGSVSRLGHEHETAAVLEWNRADAD
jgi:probable phosphoglycerate mutase